MSLKPSLESSLESSLELTFMAVERKVVEAATIALRDEKRDLKYLLGEHQAPTSGAMWTWLSSVKLHIFR